MMPLPSTSNLITSYTYGFMGSCTALEKNEARVDFSQLLAIVDELREKCPWDQKQTMKSLQHLTIEEIFEISEAILEGNMELLHIVFHARIASEQHSFSITQVIQALCNKLIYRHPHIYGQERAEDAQTVKRNWEKRKLQERRNRSLVGEIPHTLPSLIKAMRIQERAHMIDFDWQDREVAWKKVKETIPVLTQQRNQRAPMPIQQQKV
jgi:tetrapyrrole methylase family protein / MazG family protein